MILSAQQTFIIILIVSFATIITRALPFAIFPNTKDMPGYMVYLGNVIPFAAIGMLIVYCLKGVSLVSSPYGLPEGISILCVVFLHLWKRNTLISIGAGTIVYMILLQNIFA